MSTPNEEVLFFYYSSYCNDITITHNNTHYS